MSPTELWKHLLLQLRDSGRSQNSLSKSLLNIWIFIVKFSIRNLSPPGPLLLPPFSRMHSLSFKSVRQTKVPPFKCYFPFHFFFFFVVCVRLINVVFCGIPCCNVYIRAFVCICSKVGIPLTESEKRDEASLLPVLCRLFAAISSQPQRTGPFDFLFCFFFFTRTSAEWACRRLWAEGVCHETEAAVPTVSIAHASRLEWRGKREGRHVL